VANFRLGIIAAALIATSSDAVCAAEGDRMVYGAGMVTCAEWQQYRSNQNSNQNKANAFQLQAWIDGFFSGYNTASEGVDFIAPRPPTVATMRGSTIIAVKIRSTRLCKRLWR
jgi:hypothetical protein